MTNKNPLPLHEQLSEIRAQIAKAKIERTLIQSAVTPPEEAVSLASSIVDDRAARFEKSANYSELCATDHGHGAAFSLFTYAAPHDPFGLLCALFPDQIKDHVRSKIVGCHADAIAAGRPEVSRVDLSEAIAAADHRVFELECDEEDIIEAMEEACLADPSSPVAPDRRADADPAAVLYKTR